MIGDPFRPMTAIDFLPPLGWSSSMTLNDLKSGTLPPVDWSSFGRWFPPPIELDWRYGSPTVFVGGVYVFWTERTNYLDFSRTVEVVHVGQSYNIARRLSDHYWENVLKYPYFVDLCAAWAMVIPGLRDGVERYVGDWYLPGDKHPDVAPVAVTLPRIW